MSEEMKKYLEMINAAWRMFYVFRNTSTEEDIKRLHYAAKEIYRKYQCRFMLDLIAAVCNELCRRAGIDEKWNI